ncbi:MAG: exonuclease domain-containing protein [Clostridia bacterium]|nr:exonuclease domain-containing protein [Clostridia bacterium]
MYYCIMDLEWNNSYSGKKVINEVLEIGAVLVNTDLEIIDTFSAVVKSRFSDKVNGRIKQLTHISTEEMRSGLTFKKAFDSFRVWIGPRDCIFLTWGMADIRVLSENFRLYTGSRRIPFLTQFCDLQYYCQLHIVASGAQQIGLSSAAEQMGVDTRDVEFHRALEDSLIAWECLKKCHNRNELLSQAVICDSAFYDKLGFKPRYLRSLSSVRDSLLQETCVCSECRKRMKRISDWRAVNASFRALFYCRDCDRVELFTVRYKEYYDRIEIKRCRKLLDGAKAVNVSKKEEKE